MNQWIKVLTADKKRLAFMVALLAVCMLLWGRLLLQKPPRTALAQPPAAGLAATTIVPDMKPEPQTPRPALEIRSDRKIQRDIFAWSVARYPKLPGTEPEVIDMTKSEPDPVDETPSQETVVLQASNGLKLQTTMLGEVPRALINGQLLKVGDKIRGFEIIEIQARYVVLSMNGVEVQLDM